MTDAKLIGPWIRRFLMEHLVGERNLTRNTQMSYRDTLVLLLPFSADQVGTSAEQLQVEQLSAEVVRLFLMHLEHQRGCAVATRNQRLAALHALARFIGERSPEHLHWCASIRAIAFKKSTRPAMAYLDKVEMDALLDAPSTETAQGLRDYALLLFLYNTGARADEAAQLTVADLNLERSPSVRIAGKRAKIRFCPLWALTVRTLRAVVVDRCGKQPVFLNCRGQALTRFGVYATGRCQGSCRIFMRRFV